MFRKILLMLFFCSTCIPCWATVEFSASLDGGRFGISPVAVALQKRMWEFHTGLEGSVTAKGEVGVQPTALFAFGSTSYRFSISDPRSDPRLVPLRASGFSFEFPSDRHFGMVDGKGVSMYGSFGWWCSKRIIDSLWMHVFGIHGDGEVLGTMVEGMAGDVLFRFALLGLDNLVFGPVGFVIDYGSLPMQRGLLGYGYCSSRSEMGFLPIAIALRWMGRCSYDVVTGVAFTGRFLVDLSHGMFRLSYSRVDIPIQVGPWEGGGEGPMLRNEFTIGMDGERLKVNCKLTDSWWREPVYAGESQRRTLKIVGGMDYRRANTEFGFELGYGFKVRTTATRSNTFTCGLHVSTILKKVACSVSYGLSYSVSFSYELEMDFSWELDDTHTVKVKLAGTHDSIRVSLSFGKRVAGTVNAVDMDTLDGPSVSCSIDRDG